MTITEQYAPRCTTASALTRGDDEIAATIRTSFRAARQRAGNCARHPVETIPRDAATTSPRTRLSRYTVADLVAAAAFRVVHRSVSGLNQFLNDLATEDGHLPQWGARDPHTRGDVKWR
jgi:hypothetical protein